MALTSKDEKYSVMIWGSMNLEKTTGADLLARAVESVPGTAWVYSEGQGYCIAWDAAPVSLVESGYAGTESSVFFRISYPTEETEMFMDIVKQMDMELSIE